MRTRCVDPDGALEPFEDAVPHGEAVPRCPRCAGVLRPDIVLSGEPLPPFASSQAKRALRDCDLFIAIGTSGLSAASDFVRSARYAGARTVYAHLEPMSPPNLAFEEVVLGRAEEPVPRPLGGL